jgi:hypothetical protein
MPGAKEVPETEFPQEPAMNKTCLALAAVAALVATPLASAQNAAGDLVMRARVVHLDPANKDSIPGLDVGINSKVLPEVDFTYFISPNLAAELIQVDHAGTHHQIASRVLGRGERRGDEGGNGSEGEAGLVHGGLLREFGFRHLLGTGHESIGA